MKFGLKPHTISAIRHVFSQHPAIKRAILYGSRALGTYRPGSDIDLTLVGQELDLSQQLKIEVELDDLMLPYFIDLSILNHIYNKDLVDHIERVGVEFYNNSVKHPVVNK